MDPDVGAAQPAASAHALPRRRVLPRRGVRVARRGAGRRARAATHPRRHGHHQVRRHLRVPGAAALRAGGAGAEGDRGAAGRRAELRELHAAEYHAEDPGPGEAEEGRRERRPQCECPGHGTAEIAGRADWRAWGLASCTEGVEEGGHGCC